VSFRNKIELAANRSHTVIENHSISPEFVIPISTVTLVQHDIIAEPTRLATGHFKSFQSAACYDTHCLAAAFTNADCVRTERPVFMTADSWSGSSLLAFTSTVILGFGSHGPMCMFF
jgi:hypothetical protein